MNMTSGVEEDAGLHAFRFNFEEYERMDDLGLLGRAGRVELLDGRIIDMAPGSDHHAGVSAEIVTSLGVAVRDAGLTTAFRVRTHGTLKIDAYNAPEPDIYVIRPLDGRKYAEAADCVLVVEVSVSTLASDLAVKAPLYARAGIPELWVVEAERCVVRVFRSPQADGAWDETETLGEGAIRPVFAPHLAIAIADFF